jgi:hypothetical protein
MLGILSSLLRLFGNVGYPYRIWKSVIKAVYCCDRAQYNVSMRKVVKLSMKVAAIVLYVAGAYCALAINKVV